MKQDGVPETEIKAFRKNMAEERKREKILLGNTRPRHGIKDEEENQKIKAKK